MKLTWESNYYDISETIIAKHGEYTLTVQHMSQNSFVGKITSESFSVRDVRTKTQKEAVDILTEMLYDRLRSLEDEQ